MSIKNDNLRDKIYTHVTTLFSFLIPIFQYVPCTAIWFGIMSVPLLSYLLLYFQYPSILISDIRFLIRTPGFFIIILGLVIYLYSLIYQLTHRKKLLQKGPYKILRHPQYLAFIIMTLGMTLVAFQTSPILEFNLYNLDPNIILLLLWIGEVVAYIILAKVEEIALTKKFGIEFIDYKKSVGFMFPIIKSRR